jgi:ribosomal RNA-processing protein 9
VTCGADKTVRLWKIAEDTHLVFRGHKGSIDCAQILTVDSTLSAGADGTLCLWKETQKRPVAQVKAAHGYDGDEIAASASQNPRWISSLATIKMSDVVASGSNSGDIKIWKAKSETHTLEEVGSISCNGFVNGLAMSSKFLVAGTGTEHRLGRWWRMKGPLNKVIVYKFPEELISNEDSNVGENEDSDDEDSYSGSEHHDDDDDEDS